MWPIGDQGGDQGGIGRAFGIEPTSSDTLSLSGKDFDAAILLADLADSVSPSALPCGSAKQICLAASEARAEGLSLSTISASRSVAAFTPFSTERAPSVFLYRNSCPQRQGIF